MAPSIFDIIILMPENHPECGGWMVSRADGTVLGGPFPTKIAAVTFRANEIQRLETPGVATREDTLVGTSMDEVTQRDVGSYPDPAPPRT